MGLQPGRGLTFGSVAEAYERYRFDYPEELVARILRHATRPVEVALEIGAGTGKATRLFTAAGLKVIALEPDPAMLAQLATNVTGDIDPVLTTFEDADVSDPVDLVFAAAALHWTDPATRWPRIAARLAPGGVFASFGGPRELADAQVREDVRRVRERYIVSDDIPSPDGTPTDADLQWPGTELTGSTWFTHVEQVLLERSTWLTAEDFVGHLSTISAYLILPPKQRTHVLTRIRSALPERVEVNADIVLHLARRSDTDDTTP